MEYAHTWSVSKDAKLLRLYAWAWDAEPSQADFCKMAWGLIFLPVALFAHLINFLAISPVSRILTKLFPPKEKEVVPWRELVRIRQEQEKIAEEKKAKMDAKLEKWIARVTKVIDLFRLKYVASAIGAIIVGALAAAIVYLIITNFVEFLVLIGILAGSFATISLGVYVAEKKSSSFKNFTKGVKLFFKSIKYNTCPRIEVTGLEDVPSR